MITVIVFSILSILTSIFSGHGLPDDSTHPINMTLIPSYNMNLESIYIENKTNESIDDPDLLQFKPVIFQTIHNRTELTQFEGMNAWYFDPNADAYYLVINTPTAPFILDDAKTTNQNWNNLIIKHLNKNEIKFDTYYPYKEFFLLNKTKLIEQSKQPKDRMFLPPTYYMYIFVHNPIPDYNCEQLNQYLKAHQSIRSNNYEIQALIIFSTKCLQRNGVN